MSVYPGPTPPFTNPPINPDYFKPRDYTISAITLGKTTTITTSTNHDYVIGQLVRLNMPLYYGARQLDQKEGIVLSIPAANQVQINIDSSRFVDPFIPSPSFSINTPVISAIGDYNSGAINSTGRNNLSTSIDGSFQTIS